MITEHDLQQIIDDDLPTLIELDSRGLLIGAGESLREYAERLRCLRQNIGKLEDALAQTGSYEIEGLQLQADRRIEAGHFEEVRAITNTPFAFSIDWVPGFYINPRMGWLFGGCAFYFFPDFFAVFILRDAFANRRRWLIYDRTELLAHELCHVARIALRSEKYEEAFAYQTSTSGFRRAVGGIFRSPIDSFFLLGSTLFLLGAQLVNTMIWPAMPIWPFWALVILTVCGLTVRGGISSRRLKRAEARIKTVAGPNNTRAILFRCTDQEIDQLAGCEDREAVGKLLSAWRANNPRWRVISHRFITQTPPAG